MTPITTSIFDLLKIRPGPSSSHTIGPMKAGYDFYMLMQALSAEQQSAATGIKVLLYGSLAATGKGHGTDRAVLAGLLGQSPETCPSAFLDALSLEQKTTVSIICGASSFLFREVDRRDCSGASFGHDL